MEITDELMQRFFANKCDPGEFEAVTEHLRLHPGEAERYLGIAEWNAIDGDRHAPGHEEVLADLRLRLFRETAEPGLPVDSAERNAAVPVVRRLVWTSVAASLLLVVGGWLWLRNKKVAPDTLAAASAITARHREAAWITRTNATGRNEKVDLPDGSRVRLYAHSSLRYTDSFGLVSRESWLEGQAEFEVRKDKSHAFTVYAGKLATTALGTSFGVKAVAPGAMVTVKLFTGKVVVRSVGQLPGWRKDVYLLPGEEMAFDSRRMLATVHRYPVGPGSAGENPAGGGTGAGELSFNNSPLKDVFKQLSIQYHTTIYFKSSDLAGMNFTGVVSRQDSLASVVRLLATMNGLDILQQPDGIKVSRQKN
jgi:transmembrane sensor